MALRKIDMTKDPRAAHFEYFRTMTSPYVGITANCDITALRAYTQRTGAPFFLTLLHCAVNAANDVPQLRRRIQEDGVVEYDCCISSHTVALPDDTYCYCQLDCRPPLEEFLPYALAEVEKAKNCPDITDGDDVDRLLFVTSVPWVSFTGLRHPTTYPADSIPRITFGKFFSQGDKVLLPVDLTAHHALVDGLHIAHFFARLEERAAALG